MLCGDRARLGCAPPPKKEENLIVELQGNHSQHTAVVHGGKKTTTVVYTHIQMRYTVHTDAKQLRMVLLKISCHDGLLRDPVSSM